MSGQQRAVEEENGIRLIADIYGFFRKGWKTFFGASVVGAVVGVIISLYVLPVKYEASALIGSGSVGAVTQGKGVESQPVEPLSVLAEKMRSPGFYSSSTLELCGLAEMVNGRKQLVNALDPVVAIKSSFVALTFEAESIANAESCLNAVLADVKESQKALIDGTLRYLMSEIEALQAQLTQSQAELNRLTDERDLNVVNARKQIDEARNDLVGLLQLRERGQAADSSALTVMVMNKRSEIQEFESTLLAVQAQLNSAIADQTVLINSLRTRLLSFESAVEYPNTRLPDFAAPIYAPESKASPPRTLITALCTALGFFLAMLVMLARNIAARVRAYELSSAQKA